jgi:AraC-like DNA-binding protein
MITLNYAPIATPEFLFSEISLHYNAQLCENKQAFTISNESWKVKSEFLYLDFKNVAILTDTYHYATTQYNIPFKLEEKWGQLTIIRIDNNEYILLFEIRQNVKNILFNESKASYQKDDSYTWIQKEGTRLQKLTILYNGNYLKNNWGFDVNKNSNQSLLRNKKIQSKTETETLLDTIFLELYKNDNTVQKKQIINCISENVLNSILFPNDVRKKISNGLKEAEQLLIKDFRNQPDLNTLSRVAGMNRVKFQQEFKKKYGLSFYQYYQKHRFQHAEQLIKLLNYSVSEAAYATGYKHLGHFSREFFKINGIKPSELS